MTLFAASGGGVLNNHFYMEWSCQGRRAGGSNYTFMGLLINSLFPWPASLPCLHYLFFLFTIPSTCTLAEYRGRPGDEAASLTQSPSHAWLVSKL